MYRGSTWITNTIVITDENTTLKYIQCQLRSTANNFLKGTIADDVKQKILDLCNSNGWNIIAMETDKDHIHFLIGYDTTYRVCDIVKVIKQQTTYYLWQKYSNFLSKQYWKKKIFWSDGYFVCSIGEVSSATIQKYIESQC